MPANRYDQASRYGAKLDPAGLLAWLLPEAPADVRFRAWLDTRTLPWPGDPERTCDTVAHLGDADAAVHWAVPVEFSLEPDGLMFGRLLVYLGQLWREQRPLPEPGQHYQLGAVVVNLTGRGRSSRDFALRQTGLRTCLQVVERNLADEDAAAILAGIAAGAIARCLLPWVPLMRGGVESAMLAQWVALAGAELDAKRRADYGGLALVFAEAADRRPVWKEALRGWNMVESQQVLEWITEGEVKGLAESVLRLLALRFPPGAPADLTAQIRATTDAAQLRRWFDAAVAAASLEAFRQAIAP
jgi:hypothetical protein